MRCGVTTFTLVVERVGRGDLRAAGAIGHDLERDSFAVQDVAFFRWPRARRS